MSGGQSRHDEQTHPAQDGAGRAVPAISADPPTESMDVTTGFADQTGLDGPAGFSMPQPPSVRVAVSAGTALAALDVVGLLVVWTMVLLLATPHAPAGWWAAALLLYPAALVGAAYTTGLYRREAAASFRQAVRRVPVAALTGAIAASIVLLFFAGPTPPGLLAAATGAVVLAAARALFRALHRGGVLCREVMVLGAGRRAWDLAWVLAKEGRTISYRMHFIHDPRLGGLDERFAEGGFGPVTTIGAGGIQALAQRLRPDEIVVAADERRGMDMQALLECKIAGYPVSDFMGFLEREARRIDIKRIELSYLLYSDGFNAGPLDRLLKRGIDIGLSLLVLALSSPMLLVCMAVIRLQDGGPALYRQARVTQHGRVFQVLKLRTMRTDAEAKGARWAAQGDSRVTRFGSLLRRTRLDEVPQLICVLRGDMSFVGPRPERPEFVEMLATQLPLYRERHAVKAGLTGWAQVNYPYGASIDDSRSKLSYDLYYVKNFSITLDLLIVLQTIRVVLWPSGVR